MASEDGAVDGAPAHRVFSFEWSPPEEIDKGFEEGAPSVGAAVIALALTHDDPQEILPRVALALESRDPALRHQGIVALAHVARLHRAVDRRCLDLLRRYPRGNEADDDLWSFVAHRRLPWWLWRYHTGRRIRWTLRDRWIR
jgi:hypothetical protein